MSLFFIYGCNSHHPDYEANKALAQKWVKVFEDRDIDLYKEIMSKDLRDQAPLYGMGEVDYETSLQIAEFYINSYKNASTLVCDINTAVSKSSK